MSRDRHVQAVLLTIVLSLVGALLTSAGAIFLLGRSLVGKPINALLAQAARVGRGDLSTPVEVGGRDELHDLAQALNAMSLLIDNARTVAEQQRRMRDTAEQQLRHAERLSTVGKLASGLAHEMGTPLNVIAESARLIGAKGGKDDLRYGRTIQRQTTRVIEIVKDLLRFARREKASREVVDLRDIVAHTLPILRAVPGSETVDIVERSDGIPLIEGDSEQLLQVLTNLGVNGIQAMPKGGKLTIDIGSERRSAPGEPADEREYLCLSVEDQGCGIAESVLPHIFDPFFTTKDVGQGTGLGLSICYGIVKDHGGWIDVCAKPGSGSRFSVYLPGIASQQKTEVRDAKVQDDGQ